MLAVAEEKFGSSMMQLSSVPAGKTTSLALASPGNARTAIMRYNKERNLVFIFRPPEVDGFDRVSLGSVFAAWPPTARHGLNVRLKEAEYTFAANQPQQ